MPESQQRKKDKQNFQKNLPVKLITAIVLHNRSSIGLFTGHSVTYQSNVFKLPQVKYQPHVHKEFSEDKLKQHVLKYFLKEFNPRKVEHTVSYNVGKDTNFRIYYVKVAERKIPGDEILLPNGQTCKMYALEQVRRKSYLMIGENEIKILPSIIKAVEFMPI